MNWLSEAIELANQAHYHQYARISGEPYILHPLTVMMKLSDPDERIVAVLHDVIEDSDYTLNDIAEHGFSKEILEALFAITKQKDEEYRDYIRRVIANKVARNVKLADLEHNMHRCMVEGNLKRYLKYLWAKMEIINEQDTSSDPFLRKTVVVSSVDEGAGSSGKI